MPPRWLIILILGALDTIAPLTIDMYLPAFGQMAEDFGSTEARVSLSLTSYFVGLGIGQIFYGPLLDRFGRQRPLTWGLTLYVLACIGCMMSTTVGMLVAFRFVQALGSSVAAVGVRAMVRDYFPLSESPKIFSMLMLILAVSPLLAPALGSIITLQFTWPWVFAILATIVVLILIVMHLFLPEKHGADPTISLAAGPMLATFGSILRNRQFATYTLSSAFMCGALFVYLAGSTVILQGEFNVDGKQYALFFALQSIGLVAGNQMNIIFLRRFEANRIFRTAMTIQMLSALAFVVITYTGMLNVWLTVVIFFIQLGCLGLTFPNGSALAMAPFTRDLGSASALMGTLQISIGGAVSAIVGIVNMQTSLPIAVLLFSSSALALITIVVGLPKNSGGLHARPEQHA